MDDLAEFLLELILEGAAGAAGSRRVPMPVRVLAACAVGLLWFGTGGLVLWCGLATHSAGLAVLGAALLPLLRQVPAGCPGRETVDRLADALPAFLPLPAESVPETSLLREFLGGWLYA